MGGVRVWLRRWWRDYADDGGPGTALCLLVIGAVTIVLGMVDLWTDAPWGGPASRASAAWHLVPLAIGCAGLLLRRRRPAVALAVSAVTFTADAVVGGSLALLLVLFDGIYAVERFGSPSARRVVRFGAGMLTLATAVAAILTGQSLRTATTLTLQTGALLLIPIWWARDVRYRTELADAAQARADLEAARAAQQARAQEAERRSAVQAERSRMARELHDAVAGDVSAVVIRSGATLAGPPGPADRESLAAIRASGLHALEELRAMIEVLSADDGAEPMAPTLTEDAAALLTRSGATLDGGALAGLGRLSPQVDRAGYRILQEALANAARHGAGSARVQLAQHAGVLQVQVSNDLAGPADRTDLDTSRIGLTSMAERAHAVGGEVAISHDGATWQVSASLPVGAS